MPTNRLELQYYFSSGEILATGRGRSTFSIESFREAGIKIDKIGRHLKYDAISKVVDHFDEINSAVSYAIAMEEILTGPLWDRTGEPYLLAIARDLLHRRRLADSPPDFEFELDLEEAIQSPSDHLLAAGRAFQAQHGSSNTTTPTTRRRRNPFYAAYVLQKANGVCGLCQREAPFKKRATKQPYLEVHHIKPLAQLGLDVPENMVACCPNCHRKSHYG